VGSVVMVVSGMVWVVAYHVVNNLNLFDDILMGLLAIAIIMAASIVGTITRSLWNSYR